MRRFPSILPIVLFLGLAAVLPVLASELKTESLQSAILNQEVKLNVLLPDGYDERKDARFPVIYLLHGFGGDHTQWAQVGIVDEARGFPAIVVMPGCGNNFYVNRHDDPKARWEDCLVQDIVRYIDGKYRTVADRRGRGIAGLSMGGFGAMVIGMRHPEMFGSIASHSGSLGVPGQDVVKGRNSAVVEMLNKIFGPPDSKERAMYDLVALARSLQTTIRPDIYIDCGGQDFLLESNRALVAELAKLKLDYEYRETPGGHDFPYWKRTIRPALNVQLKALERMSRPTEPPARPAPAAVAKAEAPAESVSGIWLATSSRPDGSTRSNSLTLKQEGEKVTGNAEIQGSSIDITRGSLSGGKLVLEIDIERDGQKNLVRVEARLDKDKLAGQWKILNDQKEEVLAGDWNAERQKKPQENQPAAGEAISGTWEVLVDVLGNQRDYSMRFETADKALKATLISPRSGEHPAKNVAFKDGSVRLEVTRDYNGQEITLLFEGKLAGDKISGKISSKDVEEISGTWEGKRAKAPEKPAQGKKKADL